MWKANEQKLNIQSVEHLCSRLKTSPKELAKICADPSSSYRFFYEIVKDKKRPINAPRGRLKEIQRTLLKILHTLDLPNSVHGGRKGRDIVSNALPHVSQAFLLKMDIEDFFPSLSAVRVYKFFLKFQRCSPTVAQYLTQLTTLRGKIPQGAPTSTILAALVTRELSGKIEHLVTVSGGNSTQYVDDFGISGSKGIKRLVRRVSKEIDRFGLKVKESKTMIVPQGREQVIAGVRVDNGIDAPSNLISDVRQKIEALPNREWSHENFRSVVDSIRGSIFHVTRLNRGAGHSLAKRLRRNLQKVSIL